MKLSALVVLCILISCSSASTDTQIMEMFKQTFGAPCPSGWTRFNRYCYLMSSSIMTWHQAQAYCKARNGELVKINSAGENEFVLALVRKHAPSVKQVWIGLQWHSSVSRFIWTDLSVPTYTSWAPNEPNGNAGEPCGHMWTGHSGFLGRASGLWNDRPCGVHPSLPCGLVCKMLP